MLSDWFYKRIYQSAGWLSLTFLAVLVIVSGNIEIKDLDLWLHLASGRFILDTMSIPSVDVLSYTMAGQPWNNHEWLFQILITTVFQLFGAEGWITLRLVILYLIYFHLVFISYDNDRPFWPVVLLILTSFVFQLRLLLRPEIFSILFFVMFIQILSAHLDKRKTIFVLAFLQVLWVNMHGFFIFGILIIGIYILGEYIKRYAPLPYQWKSVGRLTDDEFKNIKYIFLGVIAACLVNPNFIMGALYPLKVLFSVGSDSGIFFKEIMELQKPITWKTLFSWHPYPIYRWLIIIPFVSFVLNRRRLDVGAFILWVLFLMLSLSASRNMPFYALVAYFVTLINVHQIKWEQAFPITIHSKRFLYICSTLIFASFIFWMLQIIDVWMVRGYYDYDKMERKSELGGISERNFSRKAVNFLVDNKVQGNIFNDFNSGAYLLGRTHPDLRVFIDGRTEVYGSQFFKKYKKIWKGDKALLDQAIDQYGITAAFLNSIYVAPPAKLVQYFDQHSSWHLVYFDHDALIYLKDIARQKLIIDNNEIDLNTWKAPQLNWFTVGSTKLVPYRQIIRAETLINLKHYDKAKEELAIGHIIGPYDADIYNLFGRISLKEKEFHQAYIQLRKALVIDSHHDKARFNFAKALYYLGLLDKAEDHFKRVIKKHPEHFKTLFYLGLVQVNKKTMEELLPTFEKAAELGGDLFPTFFEEEPIAQLLKENIRAGLYEKNKSD